MSRQSRSRTYMEPAKDNLKQPDYLIKKLK